MLEINNKIRKSFAEKLLNIRAKFTLVLLGISSLNLIFKSNKKGYFFDPLVIVVHVQVIRSVMQQPLHRPYWNEWKEHGHLHTPMVSKDNWLFTQTDRWVFIIGKNFSGQHFFCTSSKFRDICPPKNISWFSFSKLSAAS